MKKLIGFLVVTILLIAGTTILRRHQKKPLVSPAERQTLRDALNEGSSCPDEIVQGAKRLHYPLPQLKDGSCPYPILKSMDGSSDYSVALKQLRQEAADYHQQARAKFLSLPPDQQNFQLRKAEALCQMKSMDGSAAEDEDQRNYEYRELSTTKLLNDSASQSAEQIDFQLKKMEALSQMKGFSDSEHETYQQQYQALLQLQTQKAASQSPEQAQFQLDKMEALSELKGISDSDSKHEMYQQQNQMLKQYLQSRGTDGGDQNAQVQGIMRGLDQ